MTNPLLNFLAIAVYLAIAVWLARGIMRGETPQGSSRMAVLGLGLAAVTLHAIVLYGGQLNLSLTGAFSLVAWVVVCLYLLTSLTRPVANLGIVVAPLAAVTILLEWLSPSQLPIAFSTRAQAVHIVVSILAYSLLCLAAVQSVMLLAQESKLRRKHPDKFVRALPPMQTMEEIMFQMIVLGFGLLTLTLISGVFFTEVLFGTPFQFTHHVVLAALGWVVYALLLVGRWRFGWRGRTAVRWTLGGFSLLVLAYFGSKFVLEIILQR